MTPEQMREIRDSVVKALNAHGGTGFDHAEALTDQDNVIGVETSDGDLVFLEITPA